MIFNMVTVITGLFLVFLWKDFSAVKIMSYLSDLKELLNYNSFCLLI